MGYAVIDFETTGILPSYHHRVIEIGVAHVEDDGTVSGRWETLVNPQRDLGRQDIHGIRAADILDAPLFSDVAADFAEMLRGRVLVAHNSSFDLRFLHAEFERAGYLLNPETPSLCTMRLGASFGLGGACALGRACETFGIDLDHAHSAGHDAFATAHLLSTYQRESRAWDGWPGFWNQWIESARAYEYPRLVSSGALWQPRPATSSAPVHYLERLSSTVGHEVQAGAASEYVALLDRCLLDGSISVSEGAALVDVARELGLDGAAIEGLNADYYRALVRRAWDDGVLTDGERHDLGAVAELLRLPVDLARPPAEAAAAADAPQAFKLEPGDLVVLTGEMRRERSDWEAMLAGRGLVVHGGITKKIKLLVAADPDSLSGKARKAREYGIPVVDEAWLERYADLHSVAVTGTGVGERG